jgi:hypothetical protein
MPSRAFQDWSSARQRRLDGFERALHGLAASGPRAGRRHAAQQVTRGYAVLLTAQFQAFCRDLHTESVIALVQFISPAGLRHTIRQEFLLNRKLDRGNPNPGNLGSDFGRLGASLWPLVMARHPQHARRRLLLEELNEWRNAIAHQDFTSRLLGGRTAASLAQVRSWRRTCHSLARAFDAVMRVQLQTLTGRFPWT